MIKASGETGDGTPLLVLGLSAENCRRLLAGQPISVLTEDVDPRLPALHIVLLGGETEGAIVAEMRLQGVIHPDGR